MNVAAPLPTRLVALLGVIAAAALAFVLLRGTVLGTDETAATPAPVVRTPTTKPATTPAKPAVKPKPRLQLLPGLPRAVAHELRYEKVVVVSLYAPRTAVDSDARAEARTGAHAVDAGFLAVNVLTDGGARLAEKLGGSVSAPAVLVVRRPGKVVSSFDGFVDSAVVAQAAHNAGAR